MSLVGALLNKAATESKTPVPLVSRAAGAFTSNRYLRGATQALTAMEAASVVFGIVDRLATSVSLVDWKLWKTAKSGKPEDREEVTSHLALDILNSPNDFFSRQSLMEAAQQHQELTGESWLVVSRNPRARTIPLELWPVRPDRMEPIPSPDTYIAGYEYRSPDGECVPLAKDDVLFVHRPDPNNVLRGLGPIRSVLTDIDSIRYSMEWNKNFFMNSAEPGGIVEIDRRLSDDEFDELVARWKEQHQGVAQAHRVAILEQVKWVDRKYTMRDMQFTELRGVTEAGVKLAFGFPKFMLGQVDDVNRATADASEYAYSKWLIVPRLERWKGVFNRRFLPMFGTTASGLEFDYVSPVSEDSEAENAARTSRVNAVAALVPLGFDGPKALKAFDLPDIPFEKPEPPAPPAGGVPGFPPKGGKDPVMALLTDTILDIEDHYPGGVDHGQWKHGRRKSKVDLTEADERLVSDRLRRYGTESARKQRTRAEKMQLRQARIDLARDRAKVLATLEEVALINEDLDSTSEEHFSLAVEQNKLVDDPRLSRIGKALASRDRARLVDELKDVAAEAGLTRIGGDPARGPEQLIPFDRSRHINLTGEPLPNGRKVLLLRPGYVATIDGEELLLERARVFEATPDEIRALEAFLPGAVWNQAPEDDPDLAQVQRDWEEALAALLAAWAAVTAAQKAALLSQVAAAVAAGDLAALAALSLSPAAGAGAAALLTALVAFAQLSGKRMATGLAQQGAPTVNPVIPKRSALRGLANAVSQLLANGFAQVASRTAVTAARPGASADEVAAEVETALDSLSDRALTDQLGGALTRAQNESRLLTAREVEVAAGGSPVDPDNPDVPTDPDYIPQVIYFASEVNDRNTCFQCSNVDGTQYGSWIEAWVDYAGGKYRGCEGGLRCRGTVKARWNPAAG